MMNKINIGIIGCGSIVLKSHLPSMLQLKEFVSIIAIADVNEKNRKLAGKILGIPLEKQFSDYRNMINTCKLDIALIATPHNLHAEQSINLAEAGIGIISEKPMATTIDEADAILESVNKNSVFYTVVHNYLFNPGSICCLEKLKTLGKPETGRAKSFFLKGLDQIDSTTNWRSSRLAGGGCIGDTCYHEIYMLEALMQSPIRYVEGRVQTKFFDFDVDDISFLLLEHQNGAVSTVSTSWGMQCGNGDMKNLCEVHSREGILRLVRRGQELQQYSRINDTWETQNFPETDSPSGHSGYFKTTLNAIKDGKPPPITGIQARHNLNIIDSARKATKLRKAIDLLNL